MESNWRFNVWEVGWANSQITLVAELRTPIPLSFPPGAFVYYVARGFTGSGPARYELVPGQQIGLPQNGWVLLGPTIDNRPFPFGYDVLPDRT